MAMAGATAAQCRIGRAALGFSPGDLASAAGLPESVIVALEDGQPVSAAHAIAVAEALATAGITFFRAPDGSDRIQVRTLDGIIEAPVYLTK